MIALSGSLGHFRPIEILRLLQMTSATGRLQVTHGSEQADLYVEDGRRLFARTNGVSIRVGDILVNRGGVRPEVIALTAALQEDLPGRRLGEMLVESGVVDAEQVDKAVLEVQRRILCRVLLWRQGGFDFHPDERSANPERITIDLDVDEGISLAMRSVEALDEGQAGKRAA